jgi:hypothetical protein
MGDELIDWMVETMKTRSGEAESELLEEDQVSKNTLDKSA